MKQARKTKKQKEQSNSSKNTHSLTYPHTQNQIKRSPYFKRTPIVIKYSFHSLFYNTKRDETDSSECDGTPRIQNMATQATIAQSRSPIQNSNPWTHADSHQPIRHPLFPLQCHTIRGHSKLPIPLRATARRQMAQQSRILWPCLQSRNHPFHRHRLQSHP